MSDRRGRGRGRRAAGASRSACGPPGPQPLLSAGHGRPVRRALPARSRPASRPPPGPPVSQSASQSRSARRGSCGRSRRLSGGSAAPGRRRRRRRLRSRPARPLRSPGPPVSRAAVAVSAQVALGLAGEAAGAGLGGTAALPPPFSRRPAPPSGAVRAAELGRGRGRGCVDLARRGDGRRGDGRPGLGCTPRPRGSRRRETMRPGPPGEGAVGSSERRRELVARTAGRGRRPRLAAEAALRARASWVPAPPPLSPPRSRWSSVQGPGKAGRLRSHGAAK